MVSEAERRVSAHLAELAAAMRAGRVRIGLGELLTAHSALAAVDAADRVQAYHALRAALCSSRDDYPVFDAAFEGTFGAIATAASVRADSTLPERDVSWAERRDAADDGDEDLDPPMPVGWSDIERLRHADFSELEGEQLDRAAALMASLARRGPMRRSRRMARRTRRTSKPRGADRRHPPHDPRLDALRR